jgi:hypothetical protein
MNSFELNKMLSELSNKAQGIVGSVPEFYNEVKLYKKDTIEFDDFLAAGLFVKNSLLSNEPLLTLIYTNLAEGS